jgi:aryl-alcohol dehydrogenase (NADP+)
MLGNLLKLNMWQRKMVGQNLFPCKIIITYDSIKSIFKKIGKLLFSFQLVYREEEREMNPLCVDQGVGLIPWSPLARGFLAGNRSKVDVDKEKNEGNSATKRAQTDALSHQYYYADSDFEIVERLKTVAEKKQVKPAQIALAWILSKPGVSAPIIGASKMYQLEEAVGAASIQLSEEEIKTLEELYQPHRILGHW